MMMSHQLLLIASLVLSVVARHIPSTSFIPPSSKIISNTIFHKYNENNADIGTSIMDQGNIMPLTTISLIKKRKNSNNNVLLVLYLAKKKKSDQPKGTKIQVLLLSHVKGVGQAGEVVKVTPSFYENKLRRDNSAKRISEEEVTNMVQEKASADKTIRDQTKKVQDTIGDVKVCISKKTGPNGHLYGSVGPKVIIDELKKVVPSSESSLLSGKRVKITSIKNENGQEVEQNMIKEAGDYEAIIELSKSNSAKFAIEVINVQ